MSPTEQTTDPRLDTLTKGILSRLKCESVLGDPTICEEELDCIGTIINEEIMLFLHRMEYIRISNESRNIIHKSCEAFFK